MTSHTEPMETATADGIGSGPDHGASTGSPNEPIASEPDLLAFTRLPLEERALTPQLRGVLAESALTGRIRYKWPLLRPLIDFVLEQVLTAYDAETRVEVGPPGPDSVSETIERFQKLLSAFSDAPWTFQRLCEILLEPKRQYSRLPKLALAIEKCLLVTTEQPPTDPDQLPPLPLCSALGPVNVNPAPVYTNTHHHGSQGGHGAGSSGGADDSAAFTNSLLDLRHHSHNHHHIGNHVGTPEHIEEDHWPEGLPEGKGAFKTAGVGVGLHGPLRPGGIGGAGGSPGHGSPGAGHHGSPTAGAGGSGGGAGGGGSPGALAGLSMHDPHAHSHGSSRLPSSGSPGSGGAASHSTAAGDGDKAGRVSAGSRDGNSCSRAGDHDGKGGSLHGSDAQVGTSSTPVASAPSGAVASRPGAASAVDGGQKPASASGASVQAGEPAAGATSAGTGGGEHTLLPSTTGDADGDVAMELVHEPASAEAHMADADQQGPGEPPLGPNAEGYLGGRGETPMEIGGAGGQATDVAEVGVPSGMLPPGG